jgi:lysyl-tRNA synthetase class 2
MEWRPTAPRETLVARAGLLQRIRSHFAAAEVLEVDTPLLGLAGAADPALQSLCVDLPAGRRYLQTSPEFAMKRLLAAGSGSIYQICKAFRGEEQSRLHRGEFTMLEWYRVGFDHHQLMDEVAAIVRLALPDLSIERMSLAALAAQIGAANPHTSTTQELAEYARSRGAVLSSTDAADRSLLLDLLLEELVRVGVGTSRAAFVYDFPVEQAAYARLRHDQAPVAERFELVVHGVELANGYHEVTDPAEQQLRFEREAALRHARGLPPPVIDKRLLAAINSGLPACAGVALGLDRLLMLALNASDLGEVLAFGADWH